MNDAPEDPTTPAPAAVADRIAAAFADAGVDGVVHAVDIDRGTEAGYEPDRLVSTASVHKLCLLLALHRLAAAGRIDLTEQVECAVEGRTPGGTGLAAMLDPSRLSLRDLAYLMIAVSDNAAADLLLARVGLEEVNRTTEALGLRLTRAVESFGATQEGMRADAGPAGARALTDPVVLARLRALDPTHGNRSTPRELTRLLRALWRDEFLPAAHGAAVRRLLGLQVWPHRLASGFPFDDVRVSGKTGTLPTMRAEAGVVEYPDGGRYAVAVFTRAADTRHVLPAADAVIGVVARVAVDGLRGAS
ncbi:serine hydrolase [Streptomyces sp. SID11385]|uniref:serine hydrolase n=1 Tax=Streptomyces sp. SID11385 TaxID=2706031 RepID=UPI0013C9EAE0|nr:serine hydrolase [Streptomyces sp. SID11385]